jgi:hypothetical protein
MMMDEFDSGWAEEREDALEMIKGVGLKADEDESEYRGPEGDLPVHSRQRCIGILHWRPLNGGNAWTAITPDDTWCSRDCETAKDALVELLHRVKEAGFSPSKRAATKKPAAKTKARPKAAKPKKKVKREYGRIRAAYGGE